MSRVARQTRLHGKISAQLAGIPVLRYRDLGKPGWPGCHVIAKFISRQFNTIPANRASPAHVIRPLGGEF